MFSHGVVVEASLRLELFPAVLAFECFLQLWTGPNYEKPIKVRASSSQYPGGWRWVQEAYLMTYFHVLFEPHEGLPGNHIAGRADSLPPFMDGSLPLFLRATCEAGPGLRLVGLLSALDSRGSPHAFATGSSPPWRPVLGPARQPPPGAGWATGAGASLLTVTGVASTFFRTSSKPDPSCFLER